MPKTNPLPQADKLWEAFDYKPLTGELVRKKETKPAGSITTHGYRLIGFNYKRYMAHRLIFMWCKGFDPGVDVDHEHHNTLDNRIWNLRPATEVQNMSNRQGARGWELLPYGKYRVTVQHNKKRVRVGIFDTEAEAVAAYRKAHALACGEFSPYSQN